MTLNVVYYVIQSDEFVIPSEAGAACEVDADLFREADEVPPRRGVAKQQVGSLHEGGKK